MSAAASGIVSDASPIMNLAAVGRLDLLHKLGGTILIPEAVREEIVRGRGLPGAREVETQQWIVTRHVEDRTRVALLSAELDDGEAEAIALALQLRAVGQQPRVVMDERFGRAVCGRLGIECIGVVGVLIAAKRREVLGEIGPVLNALRKHGFRLEDRIVEQALRSVGE